MRSSTILCGAHTTLQAKNLEDPNRPADFDIGVFLIFLFWYFQTVPYRKKTFLLEYSIAHIACFYQKKTAIFRLRLSRRCDTLILFFIALNAPLSYAKTANHKRKNSHCQNASAKTNRRIQRKKYYRP